jgi:protein-L-isoaspartate(D-aspartate) O-methyltransferase
MPDRSQQLGRLLRELRSEGIIDSRVLAAIERVPRELFVPSSCRSHAFRNIPLPIGEGQTISQPFVVALMTQALALTGGETVLEVGTGSGYQTAILAELVGRVLSIERIEILAAGAADRLARLGYSNVEIRVGDGSQGCPDSAPFDAILVTAACPRTPQPLLGQLADSGRLVVPVGSLCSQNLLIYTNQKGNITSRRLASVCFVPLIGSAAWHEQEAKSYRELL